MSALDPKTGVAALVDWFDGMDDAVPDSDIICYGEGITIGQLRSDAAELKAARNMARDMAIFRPGEATPDAATRMRSAARAFLARNGKGEGQ